MEFLNKAQQFFFADKPDVTRHSPVSRKRSASFRSRYQLGKVLGKGTYSVVRKGIDLETKEKVAIKCIDELELSEKDARALQREVKILRTLKHPHIISFKDFFYDTKGKMFFIVTEFCGGGEMFDAVVAKTYYPEDKVKEVMLRLVDSVKYLHQKNITHRDLKPENILLTKPHSKGDFSTDSIKLADFGFAFHQTQNQVEDEEQLQTVCGSPIYVAPEILHHHARTQERKSQKLSSFSSVKGYPSKCVDVWSLGIIMYVLLCGYPPFMESAPQNDSNEKLFEKIKRGNVEFDQKYWKDVSPLAKDLIKKMLNVDPKKRYNIKQVLRHPWFSTDNSTSVETKSSEIQVNKTTLVQAKHISPGRWSNLKSAVNKLRFLSMSSSSMSTNTVHSN